MYDSGTLIKFHKQWGHLNLEECLKCLDMSRGNVDELVCQECELSKARRKKIGKTSVTRADQALYRVTMDLSGRKLATLSKHRYFLLITDDHSRYRWVYPLVQKSGTLQCFKDFLKMTEREQPDRKISIVRTDGGGEFISKDFDAFLKAVGIKPERSAPYSQFQNGISERGIDIIDSTARAMMLTAGSPSYDWFHAVNHAVYVRNRVPSKSIGGAIPVEAYTGVQRLLPSEAPIFGCLGFAKVYIRGKLEPKAKRVVFLGYSDIYKAALVRDVASFSKSLKEFYSRDVRFDTRIFPYRSRLVPRPIVPALDAEDVLEKQRVERLEEKLQDGCEQKLIEAEGVNEEGEPLWEVDKIIDVRKAKGKKGKEYKVVWKPAGTYEDSWEHETQLSACNDLVQEFLQSAGGSINSVYERDPRSRKEALESDLKDEWLLAEQQELSSIKEMGVWSLVPRQDSMKVVGSKFVYKTKRFADGSVERFKVRLVAQGFTQTHGVDYEDVFATTASMQSIRVILWLVVFYNMSFWKVDIRTFYLYGTLEETIYMKQPPGYEVGDDLVCKLHKSLYGLKQAMRCACKVLAEKFLKYGLFPLKTDSNVYFRKNDDGVIICFAWSDDIGVVGTSRDVVTVFVEAFQKEFDLQVEEEPSEYLKLQVYRNRQKKLAKFSQEGYLDALLQKYDLQSCNSRPIPLAVAKLPNPKEVVMDPKVPFQQLVGALIWVSRSRPDISFAVSVLCRYMTRYDESLYKLALQLLRYLKGTKEFGIVYDESSSNTFSYGQGVNMLFQVDSDFGGRIEDSRSTTGWLVRLGNSTVYSGSAVQKRVALNTCEAESNGMELVCREVEWYRDFLGELEIKIEGPTIVQVDNNAALALAKDPVMRPRTKYFRIPQDYIRSCVRFGKVLFQKEKSENMVVDMLNKALSFPAFSRHRTLLLGDQNVQVGDCAQQGVQYSSNDAGDGPARTKRVSRRTPLAVRRARKVQKRKQQELFDSLSDHIVPLACSCPTCQRFLPWSETLFDWRHWDDGCEQDCNFKVSCVVCNVPSKFDTKLEVWYCPECSADALRPTRFRRRPNYYAPEFVRGGML